MRILQLHARYRIAAGEDTVVANEASTLRRGGHTVHQVILDNPTGPVESVKTLARSIYNRRAAATVRAEIDVFRPQVVHVHNTWFALSSAAVEAAATRAPVVMTVHNYRLGCLSADLFRDGAVCTACVGHVPLRGVAHGCYRGSRVLSAVAATEITATRRRQALTRSVTRFVAPSSFMADRLVDIGLPADRLTVKAHFVADPGARHGPPSASGEVLSIGRLAPGKGLGTLLDGWSLATRPGMHLAVLGDGPLAEELTARSTTDVRLEGWTARPAVMERMLRARALVFPSQWYEPFGMVLIEAMSAGLPIIVSTVAGARDIVDPPGFLVVSPGDPDAVSAALDRLDDRTVDAVGAANRARYEARYTEAVGLAALEDLYTDVIGQHQRPRARR